MNPSVKDLLNAVDSALSDKVILLPNNKNVILTASQVKELTSKRVAVVPTKTMPQGLASILAFDSEASLEENAKAMVEACTRVRTIAITKAARTTEVSGLSIKEGQAIAIIDDEELVATGDDVTQVVLQAMDKIAINKIELVTIYYGRGTEQSRAQKIAEEIGHRYPGKQVDLIEGGQPYYSLIISIE